MVPTPSCRAVAVFHAVAGFALLAFVVSVLLAAAPARAADAAVPGASVRGAGRDAHETRAVGAFQAIVARGSIKLVLRQGAREAVDLAADADLLPLIDTRVVDRAGVPTLEIGLRRDGGLWTWTARTPVATIDVVTLKRLALEGSGDVVAAALRTPTLAVAIRGSGDVRIDRLEADEFGAEVAGSGAMVVGGRVSKLAISVAGSGNVDTRQLEADSVSVSLAGSGDAAVAARRTLDVSIAGTGSVGYRGDAVVSASIAGRGKVRRL